MGQYFHPVVTYFGPGVRRRLGQAVGALDGVDAILLLTRGGSLTASREYREIREQLAGLAVAEYGLETANPDIMELFALLQRVGDRPFQLVVAVGGGSVLDTGKALAGLKGMTVTSPERLREIIASREYCAQPPACRWIGMPTTAGTGSELTPWATFWDRQRKLKYSLDSPGLFAHAALVDPELTLSLPVKTTVVTALDALCHAAEAYWAKNSNEVSRLYALGAIERIIGNLGTLVNYPTDLTAREQVALGSFYAGMAFSNTRTTACHSISYPLTLLHGIEHGLAAALTLAPVLQWNGPALVEKGRFLAAFGVDNCGAVGVVVDRLFALIGRSARLSDFGVTEADLPEIVDRAFTKGRMDNNPVALDAPALLAILRGILK